MNFIDIETENLMKKVGPYKKREVSKYTRFSKRILGCM